MLPPDAAVDQRPLAAESHEFHLNAFVVMVRACPPPDLADPERHNGRGYFDLPGSRQTSRFPAGEGRPFEIRRGQECRAVAHS
jgi:hypothetical protein